MKGPVFGILSGSGIQAVPFIKWLFHQNLKAYSFWLNEITIHVPRVSSLHPLPLFQVDSLLEVSDTLQIQ